MFKTKGHKRPVEWLKKNSWIFYKNVNFLFNFISIKKIKKSSITSKT